MASTPTKAELLEQAKSKGLDVNTKTTKSELEELLSSNSGSNETSGGTQNAEEVEVNQNNDGEATNGTTKNGEDAAISNTESVPQNGVDEIQTTEDAGEQAKQADERRTDEEVEFADESNPNQKARNAATEGEEYDQDGNRRTGGKSYGVSADDTRNTVHDETNDGEKDDKRTGTTDFSYLNPEAGSDNDTNAREMTYEDQKSLEESLSEPSKGVTARVTTSTGQYVRVKFFWNNKPLTTYKSRNYNEGEAIKARDEELEARGL